MSGTLLSRVERASAVRRCEARAKDVLREINAIRDGLWSRTAIATASWSTYVDRRLAARYDRLAALLRELEEIGDQRRAITGMTPRIY